MKALWSRWVAHCYRPVDTRPMALLRILVALCIVLDLLRVAQLGLVDFLFTPYTHGGLSVIQESSWVLDDLLGADVAGPVAYVVSLVCMMLVALGVAVRPAIVVGVLAYAQLGHTFPPGDRAIDRVLRMALLIVLFSGAHRRFTLSNLLGWTKRLDQMPAWTEQLLRFAVVLIYMNAGIAKLMQQPRWLAIDGRPVLYRVVTDPLAAVLDPVFWTDYPWLFRFGGIGTIIFEVAAFVLLTRVGPYWALMGLGMHLGIFTVMKLGMFSWGMLALYPVLMAPLVVRAFDRLGERRS